MDLDPIDLSTYSALVNSKMANLGDSVYKRQRKNCF